ncbi:MAG TPA: hypothetical protein DCL04_04490 [Synergistaceae bacterium]|jgi:hypothetical protein|nr:hypothetical protein [Synergistaceae bacterium]
MKKKFAHVYQFKITLKGSKPPIWRRIQVPETYTFWDLHVAIQNAMRWGGGHLHAFEMRHPVTGERMTIKTIYEDDLFLGREVISEHAQKIANWFSMENRVANYIYDFGDGWEHRIELEKILPRDENIEYPICIAGKRACPPEDCGGIWGYGEFLEAIRNPEHERHEELLEWVGGEFDPERFDPKNVYFEDPEERRKYELDE